MTATPYRPGAATVTITNIGRAKGQKKDRYMATVEADGEVVATFSEADAERIGSAYHFADGWNAARGFVAD